MNIYFAVHYICEQFHHYLFVNINLAVHYVCEQFHHYLFVNINLAVHYVCEQFHHYLFVNINLAVQYIYEQFKKTYGQSLLGSVVRRSCCGHSINTLTSTSPPHVNMTLGAKHITVKLYRSRCYNRG